MSADNAIYIRPLKNGKFAVKCISSFYTEGMTENEIDLEFENSTQFDSQESVDIEIERINDEYESEGMYIEYQEEYLTRLPFDT
jgi:hypothetical protein